MRRSRPYLCHNLGICLQIPRHAAVVVLHEHAVLEALRGLGNAQVQSPLCVHRCLVACRQGVGWQLAER